MKQKTREKLQIVIKIGALALAVIIAVGYIISSLMF